VIKQTVVTLPALW